MAADRPAGGRPGDAAAAGVTVAADRPAGPAGRAPSGVARRSQAASERRGRQAQHRHASRARCRGRLAAAGRRGSQPPRPQPLVVTVASAQVRLCDAVI